MREFVITDASMPPVWTPRCLRSILSFPPAGCAKYLRENKIKVDGKLPLSARLPRGSTVRVFCRICFWISRTGFLSARPELCINDVLAAPVTEDGRTHKPRSTLLYPKYAPERWTPRLCHRLDTGTSGLVLIAKTQQAEALLLHLVKERMIEKNTSASPLDPLACGKEHCAAICKGRPTGACSYSGHIRARSKRYCDKI